MRMSDQQAILPPHFEVVTFPWIRWLEVYYALIDQKGDTTVGMRATIWDALQLNRGVDRSRPVSLVFLSSQAESIRYWEAERTDAPADRGEQVSEEGEG
jgi:hypothetical protein